MEASIGDTTKASIGDTSKASIGDTNKVSVKGIILVTSCQKYQHTRLKELNLKAAYGDWKVICVIGDLFLDCDYKLENNLLRIKCEDAYIYNLKKFVLSLKYLYEMFDIAEGVLRANDDLVFNERFLEGFLRMPKKLTINTGTEIDIDFLGRSSVGHSLINYPFVYEPHRSGVNPHLVNYYQTHQEDFDNPLHNIKGVDVLKYSVMPHIPAFLHGPLIYFSNKSCKILIEHMEGIGYDIYHYHEKSNSYPYTIDDLTYPLILLPNNINLLHTNNWHKELQFSPAHIAQFSYDICGNFENSPECIAFHTNKYK
jgi:hypothetical protein